MLGTYKYGKMVCYIFINSTGGVHKEQSAVEPAIGSVLP